MGLILTSPPSVEPVTTAEAKSQCRISTSTDDSYLDSLVKLAREQAESYCNRALITQTWALTLDAFPCGIIPIPMNPLISVTSITYVDTSGATQTWAADQYQVDNTGQIGRIIPAYGVVYPSTRSQMNAVTVTFTAGYGASASNVPETFKHAIKLMVAHWYDNRGDQGTLPVSAERLLFPLKLMGDS